MNVFSYKNVMCRCPNNMQLVENEVKIALSAAKKAQDRFYEKGVEALLHSMHFSQSGASLFFEVGTIGLTVFIPDMDLKIRLSGKPGLTKIIRREVRSCMKTLKLEQSKTNHE